MSPEWTKRGHCPRLNQTSIIMKAIILQRSVYYKTAKVEIEIPNIVRDCDIQEYLMENEHLWSDKIDEEMEGAEFEFGFGMDEGKWTEKQSPSEWRYEVNGFGGHL